MRRLISLPRLEGGEARLLGSVLVDWMGTGLYVSLAAIFATHVVGLTATAAGAVLSAAGLVALSVGVPLAKLADQVGVGRMVTWLHVARAWAFVLIAVSPSPAVYVIGVVLIGVGDHVGATLDQALAAAVAGPRERIPVMARVRTTLNVGVALGTLGAGAALAAGTREAFAAALLVNAASHLVVARMIATLPARGDRARAIGRSEPLPAVVRSPAFVALVAFDGVMTLWLVILNVGLSLWLVDHTAVPAAVVAPLYALNTVLCIAFQIRASRGARDFASAIRTQRRAAAILAAGCLAIGAVALCGRDAGIAVAAAGTALVTAGEMLAAAASWGLSAELADHGRRAGVLAAYNLGRAGRQVVGPLLMTGAVLAAGEVGWIGLGAVFALVGVLTGPTARAARQRVQTDVPPPARAPAPTRLSPYAGLVAAR